MDKSKPRTLINAIRRLLHHRLAESQSRRAIAPEALQRLAARVAASEQRHTGQIRIVTEACLPWSYLRRHANARERALMLFSKYRVWDTDRNNGVLIYLLMPERAIEIVADRGVHPYVSPKEWQAVAMQMASHFQNSQYEEGLAQAIDAISYRLESHFPRTENAPRFNELPDRPVVQ